MRARLDPDGLWGRPSPSFSLSLAYSHRWPKPLTRTRGCGCYRRPLLAICRRYAACSQPAPPSTRATDKAARCFSSLSTRTMSRSRRRSSTQARA